MKENVTHDVFDDLLGAGRAPGLIALVAVDAHGALVDPVVTPLLRGINDQTAVPLGSPILGEHELDHMLPLRLVLVPLEFLDDARLVIRPRADGRAHVAAQILTPAASPFPFMIPHRFRQIVIVVIQGGLFSATLATAGIRFATGSAGAYVALGRDFKLEGLLANLDLGGGLGVAALDVGCLLDRQPLVAVVLDGPRARVQRPSRALRAHAVRRRGFYHHAA